MLPASNLLPADGASKVPMNASVPVASSVSSGPVHSRAAIIGARPVTFERMSAGQASAIASSLKRAQPQPVGKTASVFGGGVAHSTDSSSQRGGPVQGVVLHGVSNARNVQSASNSGGSSRTGHGSRSGVAAFQNTPSVSEATRAIASSGSPLATAGRCKRRVNCEDDGSSSTDSNESHGSEGSSNSGGAGGGRKPVVPIVPKCADVVVHGGVKMPPIPPVEFLRRILVLHRYDVGPVSSLNTSGAYYHRKPTPEQVAAYDMEIVRAVRSSELERLGELKREGRSMDACNRFGESVLHMACRRGSTEMVQFLTHECSLGVSISDDFGRTPLHDACWTPTPNFEVVALLLNADRHLVMVADSRASLPLAYIHEDLWGRWCNFLMAQRDVWWNAARAPEWDAHLAASRNSLAKEAEAAAAAASASASAADASASSPVRDSSKECRAAAEAAPSAAPALAAEEVPSAEK